MGLLGTGGITHGATPYLPNRWYFVELRFDWENKEVAYVGSLSPHALGPATPWLGAATPCATVLLLAATPCARGPMR